MPEDLKPGRKPWNSEIATWEPGEPIPDHRVNLGTTKLILKHELGVVTTVPALRRLPVSRQRVGRIVYLDPREVLAHYRKKFRETPIVVTGLPLDEEPPPRAIPTRRKR